MGNLHYLSLVKIDVPTLIHYPQRASPRTDLPHHLSTYRLALLLTLPFSLSILLADVLTSYAKIIADLFVALCMFFSHNGSATKRPDRACGGQYLVPIIIAIPSPH